MKRKHLSLAIGCVLMLPAAAWAQDAAPATEPAEAISPAQAAQQAAETTTLGAIEVTARRRTESIQDVPVAVTAFGEDQLKDLQAGDIGGLQGAVPNLNIVQGRGSANSVGGRVKARHRTFGQWAARPRGRDTAGLDSARRGERDPSAWIS